MTTRNHSVEKGATAAGRAVDTARKRVEEMADDAHSRFGDVAQNVQERAHDAIDHARDAATQARDYVQDKTAQLRDSAGEYWQDGRARAMEIEETIEDQIRNQPLRAVLIAAAVGVVLGMFWTRRR